MRSKLLRALLLIVILFVVVIGLLAILADPAQPKGPFADGPPRPWVIAHQGGDGLWPGDTMFAFEHADELGVDVLEMDVHSTADGALVLMHDDTVDRTTDGSGLISDMTLAQIKELDAGYNWTDDDQTYPFRGQGITVPTLDEVFDAFPEQLFNIEIKQAEPSITEPFCAKIREYELVNQVFVASFDQEALDEFRQVCPEVATSTGETDGIKLLVPSFVWLETIHSPRAQVVQTPEEYFGMSVLRQRTVDAAHNRGMEMHAWTINETEDMARLLALGLDGIITDRPDRMLELLAR
ncbi:MAG: glycerophosphodiester phosphodiesterase [Chloroflexota bacterium]|jgi:glycerophosphoryl diester phosphodiesterase